MPPAMTRRSGQGRKSYTSEQPLTCAGCRQPIPAGQPFFRGLTKEPWHKPCRRIGVSGIHTTAPRYQHDNPVGAECTGCGMSINADDLVVFKSTLPWHRDCAVRRM